MARTSVSLDGWVRTGTWVSASCILWYSLHTVNVSGTAGVVTREGGLEVNNTVGIALLDTAQEGGVDVQLIGGVTVATGNNSRVDTLFKLVIWLRQ